MSAAAAQFQAAKKCSGDAHENARQSASRHQAASLSNMGTSIAPIDREIATSLDLKIDHQVTTSRDQ
jgi:hypothetical protein